MPPCSVSSTLPRSSLTGWKMPCHPDSERHVPSYTTLVPRWRGIGHSCSACVSGMRWVLYVCGGALRVFARVVGLSERRDVVHGCPSLGEVTQWRDVRAIIRAEFARTSKSFEVSLEDAKVGHRCPVLGPKACCSCPLFYRCEGLWARGGLYLRRLVGGRSTGRCLRGIHPIVPVSSLFLLERMKQWPRAPHTREGKSDGPV